MFVHVYVYDLHRHCVSTIFIHVIHVHVHNKVCIHNGYNALIQNVLSEGVQL